MSYHVRFENVGRDHQTWECEIAALTERDLNKEVRKALMSRDIGYDLDDADYGTGDIYIGGGTRHVGTFTFWKRTKDE
jgi:hypothetical protein